MTATLRRILYISQVADGVTDAAIKRLVAKAQMNNRRRDLSGVLALGPGLFAQVLEGSPDAIEDMLSRIVADPRHSDVRVVTDALVQERLFDRWSMELLVDEGSASLAKEVFEHHGRAAELMEHLRQQHAQDPLWWTQDLRGMALDA